MTDVGPSAVIQKLPDSEENLRFQFGENWRRFLSVLTEERILEAERSLREMLEVVDLKGKSFIDIGSGSGLFSLAAARLGASKIHSFDYDPSSVACTAELRRRYFPGIDYWKVEQGSVLDPAYLESLGKFDIVYSWGVLHHTGDMWLALKNADVPVSPGGLLFIALYNDEGSISQAWKTIKKSYNRLPPSLRFLITIPSSIILWGPTTVKDLIKGKPFSTWRNYVRSRGMSPWADVVDWVGGYPFEVAKREDVFEFYKARGYSLRKMKTTNRLGNNEFVFQKRGE